MTEPQEHSNPEDLGAQRTADGWLWPVGDGSVGVRLLDLTTGDRVFRVDVPEYGLNATQLTRLRATIGKALKFRKLHYKELTK